MTRIALEGMEFYAYHGFYEEESKMGGTFIVDVDVNLNASKGAASDALEHTINYETIYFICKKEMKKTSKLIENVAHRILNQLKFQFGINHHINVRIRKLHPPLGGKVAAAVVEIEHLPKK
ncbi:MAG: dihydroneopterin aldolase [Bacteroidota bacterium]